MQWPGNKASTHIHCGYDDDDGGGSCTVAGTCTESQDRGICRQKLEEVYTVK